MRIAVALIALVLTGCPRTSEEPPTPAPAYHPRGFAEPMAHGPPMLLQQDACNTCHGADLRGSADAGVGFLTSVGCDDCHRQGWREDCTYCHGGGETDDGAPPRGIGGAREDFPHTAHVASDIHAARECTLCHAAPEDVLSEGHIFDTTPGVAEVDMTSGAVPDAEWDGKGCSNNACHGNGQAPGDVLLSDAPLGCGGCHTGPESEYEAFEEMSGAHRRHNPSWIPCSDCHPNFDANHQPTSPEEHVNLQVEVQMPPQMMFESGQCTGTCHDEPHEGLAW